MNKTAIKNFAIWARNKLIKEITYKAGLVGVTEKGIADALPQSTKDILWFDIGTSEPPSIQGEAIKQREKLVQHIREKEKDSDYKTAYTSIIEEVAYTWFNRLIAIRFMEVNDYLPSRVRVLSSETAGKEEPDLVTTPFASDLEFTSTEVDLIMQYKDTNQLDELFRMLFIKQCNKLNEILPQLFERTNDYTEFLLKISYTDKDGIVRHLINDITEDDFKEAVEIIGWLYQSYISEPKDLLINARSKYKNENIPFVTQLFTSDWIVKYMVDNSLGRYWIERNPNSKLAEKLEYFIRPKDHVIQCVDEKLAPEELTFFDPCMGSGHILVYAFDVLMEIYRECGYADRDAAQSIIEHNLFGLDIDGRAYQLAYFSILMKARSYDRRFLTRKIAPQVYCPKGEDNDCSTYGSLFNIDTLEEKPKEPKELTIFNLNWQKEINNWNFRRLLSQKYTIICTNPPYMNSSYMPTELKKYVEKEYKDYKSDLFSAFMVKGLQLCKNGGYVGMLTPYVWMFISSYEKLRTYILSSSIISSLVQLEYNAFEGACVPVCSFVLKKTVEAGYGEYIKLSDFKGIDVQAPRTLEAINNPNCDYRYIAHQENFFKIPGSPIAYWVSDKIFNLVSKEKIKEVCTPCLGMRTGDNDRFLRFWYEVDIQKASYSHLEGYRQKKWIPFNKGGGFRRWYGLNEYVVNWENNGFEVKENTKIKYGENISWKISNEKLYFTEGFTWGSVTSGITTFRYYPAGYIFSNSGQAVIMNDSYKEKLFAMGAFLNSKLVVELLKVFSPTIGCESGYVAKLPFNNNIFNDEYITDISQKNVMLAKADWDSFEISWDFKRHPLTVYHMQKNEKESRIELCYYYWKEHCEFQFNQLKSNEEELNNIFIDIYGLQDELTPDVDDKDVSVCKADLTRDIKSFISYAVGCMFGRYSLDIQGLAYAGGDWDESKYTSFIPYKDNIILITEDEYFKDDIVNRFVEFVKVVYGEKILEENLDFIANALCNKGNTSREVIRNYFIKDFYKDHCKIYQKRPIYWLFDSGKQNGFKALIYMHRYNADTIGNLRIDYLHRLQRVYESEIARIQDIVDNSNNAKESTAAAKRRDKLVKQLQETKDYDQKIAHLALARTEIDLDDGVKVNYDKIQTSIDGTKLQVLAKI